MKIALRIGAAIGGGALVLVGTFGLLAGCMANCLALAIGFVGLSALYWGLEK